MKILNKIKFYRLLTLFLIPLIGSSCSDKGYTTLDGFALGTTYHITFLESSSTNLKRVDTHFLDSLFKIVNSSLSVYDPNSLISRVNRGERVLLDSHMEKVFLRAKEIYQLSDGAFDASASPLFNLWGFGFEKRDSITEAKIEAAIALTGMDKIELLDGYLNFAQEGMELNFNAIAKGYCCDYIAKELEQLGAKHYLVEIGGEIVSKGKNRKGRGWSVGIDTPIEGNIVPGASLKDIIVLSSGALATSGNYRQFWREGEEVYSHTIDPKSGYPARNTLLSATVIAPDAMSADAYATWFMVVGLERAKEVITNTKEIEGYLIYSEGDSLKVFKSDGVIVK